MRRAIALVEFLVKRSIHCLDKVTTKADQNLNHGMKVIRENNGRIKASDFRQKLRKRVGNVDEVDKQVIQPLTKLGKIVVENVQNKQGRFIDVISLAKD